MMDASTLQRIAAIEARLKALEERIAVAYPPPQLHVPMPAIDIACPPCPKCGIKLDGGVMSYFCAQPGCPTGLGSSS